MADKSTDDLLRDAGVFADTSPNPNSTPEPDWEPDDLPRTKATGNLRTVRDSLLQMYTGAEMVLFAFGDVESAQLVNINKGNCCDAWIELARKDPRVKALLIKLTTGGAWGGVVMAHAPIALAVLARRGILPGGALFGAFSEPEQAAPVQDFMGGTPPESGNVTANGYTGNEWDGREAA